MACIFRPSFVLFVLLFRIVNSVLFVLQLCTFRFSDLSCPKCGTYAYYIVRKEETTNHYITHYKCLYCDHEDRKKRPKESPARDIATAAAAGSILGGLSGRGGFGSSRGSSGGGWGGGSTGGGGAGGSW